MKLHPNTVSATEGQRFNADNAREQIELWAADGDLQAVRDWGLALARWWHESEVNGRYWAERACISEAVKP